LNPTDTPLFISWEITNRCNLECKICYTNSTLHNKDSVLSEDTNFVISQIKECKPFIVDIGGGEPLIRKDVYAILKKLSENGLSVRLASNGTIDASDRLKECGISTIQISIDGFKETHEKIRAKNTFDKTIKNIKKYISNNFFVGIASVVTSYNVREIPKLAQYFLDLGVNKYTSFRFVPMGRGAFYKDLWVNENDLKWLKEELKKLEEKFGSEYLRYDHSLNFFSDEKNFIDSGGCELGQKFLGIKPNGDVVACSFFPLVLGNIKKNSLIDIWKNSETLNELRKSIANIDNLEGKCSKCRIEIKKICRGGCRAVAYHMTNNLYAPDPRCWR